MQIAPQDAPLDLLSSLFSELDTTPNAPRARRERALWSRLIATANAWPDDDRLPERISRAALLAAKLSDAARSAPPAWWRSIAAGEGEPRMALARALWSISADVGDRGVKNIAGAPECADLVSLRVDDDSLTDAAAHAIADSDHMKSLRELHLNRNSIGDEGAAALARSPVAASLSMLSLAGNRIGDAGVIALAESAQMFGLGELILSENRLGDAGVIALAHARNMRALEHLHLYGNEDIGAEGAGALLRRLPQHFTGLLDLTLHDTSTPRKMLRQIDRLVTSRWLVGEDF